MIASGFTVKRSSSPNAIGVLNLFIKIYRFEASPIGLFDKENRSLTMVECPESSTKVSFVTNTFFPIKGNIIY